MGTRNRFFPLRRLRRQFENPPLESLREGGVPFQQGRFQALANPENRRLKTANLLAQFARIADPTGPIPGLAREVAQGATAEAVRADRFSQLQTGAAPRISSFGLSAEQVGQIDRDATNRFQFVEGQRLAGERATAAITSREDIAAAGVTSREKISGEDIDARIEAAQIRATAAAPQIRATIENQKSQRALAEFRLKLAKTTVNTQVQAQMIDSIFKVVAEVGGDVGAATKQVVDLYEQLNLISSDEAQEFRTLDLTGVPRPAAGDESQKPTTPLEGLSPEVDPEQVTTNSLVLTGGFLNRISRTDSRNLRDPLAGRPTEREQMKVLLGLNEKEMREITAEDLRDKFRKKAFKENKEENKRRSQERLRVKREADAAIRRSR